MPPRLPSGVQVVRAEGDLRRIALAVLGVVRLEPGGTEADDPAAPTESDPSRLECWLAVIDSHPAGAACRSIPADSPGASVWPPVVLDAERQDEIADLLLDALHEDLLQSSARWIQAVTAEDASGESAVLERHGYERAGKVLFLERTPEELPEAEAVPGLWSMAYRPELRARFAHVYGRTLIGSRDFPALHDLRTADEALAGHGLPSGPDALWRLYGLAEEAVALLLSRDFSENGHREICYVGVVPECRRRGIGRTVLMEALREAQRAGVPRIEVVCDSANEAAAEVYERLGFVLQGRQVLWIRRIPGRC